MEQGILRHVETAELVVAPLEPLDYEKAYLAGVDCWNKTFPDSPLPRVFKISYCECFKAKRRPNNFRGQVVCYGCGFPIRGAKTDGIINDYKR